MRNAFPGLTKAAWIQEVSVFVSCHKLTSAVCAVFVTFGSISLFRGKLLPNPILTSDSTGVLGKYGTWGGIDINNASFQSTITRE